MSIGFPFSSRVMDGTVDNGARSETVDCVRWRRGRRVDNGRGGDEGNMPVEEVGTGVG